MAPSSIRCRVTKPVRQWTDQTRCGAPRTALPLEAPPRPGRLDASVHLDGVREEVVARRLVARLEGAHSAPERRVRQRAAENRRRRRDLGPRVAILVEMDLERTLLLAQPREWRIGQAHVAIVQPSVRLVRADVG